MKIEFRDDSATLECGAALSSEGYAVVPEDGQLVVKLRHSAGPLSLVLQPNGTLNGTGSVDVNGRKIYRWPNRRHRLHASERTLHIRYSDSEQVNKEESRRRGVSACFQPTVKVI